MKREAVVWQRAHHPNVLRLYGFRSGEEPALVSPYCPHGSIWRYLETHPDVTFLEKLNLVRVRSRALYASLILLSSSTKQALDLVISILKSLQYPMAMSNQKMSWSTSKKKPLSAILVFHESFIVWTLIPGLRHRDMVKDQKAIRLQN